MTPPRLTAPTLHLAGVSHGFFSRDGGVSSGVYRSLNVGLGSEDDPVAVSQNRERCRQTLNSDVLLTLYQVHSPDVVIVDEP
ncbi:MAG: laccase domain-containing protein, partial [Parvularculaceae bacterium]|nr:laccase domain-containing protein [Parvularculaceae bacterium]